VLLWQRSLQRDVPVPPPRIVMVPAPESMVVPGSCDTPPVPKKMLISPPLEETFPIEVIDAPAPCVATVYSTAQ